MPISRWNTPAFPERLRCPTPPYPTGVASVLSASALDQARWIREGELSSEELTRIYLERIASRDGKVGSLVEVHPERSLFAARRLDSARRSHRGQTSLPQFFGVPTAIKDLNFVRGMFTRMGSRAFCMFSPIDDLVTRQVRSGGFVIVGKTAASEFGISPFVETDIHPPTRNPWDLSRTAGGSSGGAGAAVGGALLPIAVGSDGGGSVRIPASYCGLVGLKPSRGRVLNAYGVDDHDLVYTHGPMARTVRDSAALLDLLAGLEIGRPSWAPRPPQLFRDAVDLHLDRLRVRVCTTSTLVEVDSEVAEVVELVGRALENSGHEVATIEGPNASIEEFMPAWEFMAASAPVRAWERTQPVTRWLAERGRGLTEADSAECVRRLTRKVLDWFGDIDLLICPTVAVLPEPIGSFGRALPEDMFFDFARLGVFTAPFNASGQPAITLPIGRSRIGIPIGVQLVARPFDDATLLTVARLLETTIGFAGVGPAPDESATAHPCP